MTSPLNIVIRAMPVQAASAWDVASARAALDEHEAGDFASSALLLDAFGRDDRIGACLTKRTGALAAKRGLPFEVLPSDRDGRRSSTHAKAVERLWWDAHNEACLRRVQRDAIGLGVCVGRIAWLKDGGMWAPRLIPLHASNLHFDANRGGWLYRAMDGDLPVTPGDGNWFLYTPGGDLDPWLDGAVRALAIPFVLRGFTWRDWARWTERHGMPLIKAKHPTQGKDAKLWLTALANLGTETVVPMPQPGGDGPGYDLELLEAKDTAHAGFQTLLERIDLCTAVYLLGQNLTTEVQAGAYASSVVHKNIEGTILSGDAESLATVLREQVWKPWARFNYGDADLAPWGSWDTAPPEDRKASADTLKTAGEALTIWTTLGVPVDIEAYAERFSLELRAGARVPEPEAPDPDKEPVTEPAPPTAPGQPEEPPAEPAPVLQATLDAKRTTTGVTNGQDFVDVLAARAADSARKALAPDVAALLTVIEGAASYDDVKARITLAFADMSPAKLSELTAKALVLSRIAGRAAVLEDL